VDNASMAALLFYRRINKETIYKNEPESVDVGDIEMYLSLDVGILDRFHTFE